MKVPVVAKIAGLTVAATAFYTYVGQLVPQKEVLPPVETKMAATMTTAELVTTGKTLFEDKGSCLTCHTVGKTSGPFRFPDLGGVGGRASTRVAGLDGLQYLAQSLYHPNDFIVPGFSPGMPIINKPPIGLTDDEIRAVIAYLESLGGSATVTMQTAIPYAAGGTAPAGAETAAAAAAGPAAAGAEADVATAAAAAPASASAPRPPEALLTQFQCATCHQDGKQKPSLDSLAAGKRESEILAGLAAHSQTPARFEEAMSLAEARELARFLAARKGGGA